MNNIKNKIEKIASLNKDELINVYHNSELILKELELTAAVGLPSEYSSFKEYFADIKIEVLSSKFSLEIMFITVNSHRFLIAAEHFKKTYNFDLIKIYEKDIYKTSVKDYLEKNIPIESILANTNTSFYSVFNNKETNIDTIDEDCLKLYQLYKNSNEYIPLFSRDKYKVLVDKIKKKNIELPIEIKMIIAEYDARVDEIERNTYVLDFNPSYPSKSFNPFTGEISVIYPSVKDFKKESKKLFEKGGFEKLGHAREYLAKQLGFDCYRAFLKSKK